MRAMHLNSDSCPLILRVLLHDSLHRDREPYTQGSTAPSDPPGAEPLAPAG